MRTKLLACFLAFLALSGTLQAADPWVGTWKLNVGKSKPIPAQPGMALKESSITIQATSERYEVTDKATRENGSAISMRYSAPTKGGSVVFSKGALPAGTSDAWKRINDSTGEFITTRDGKVVMTRHVMVSADGKTMRADIEGIDAQGKLVQGMELFDKQ